MAIAGARWIRVHKHRRSNIEHLHHASGALLSDNGTQIQCVVTNSSGSVTTNAATLNVQSSGGGGTAVRHGLGDRRSTGHDTKQLQRLGGHEPHRRREPVDRHGAGPDVRDGQSRHAHTENRQWGDGRGCCRWLGRCHDDRFSGTVCLCQPAFTHRSECEYHLLCAEPGELRRRYVVRLQHDCDHGAGSQPDRLGMGSRCALRVRGGLGGPHVRSGGFVV